MSFFSSAAAEAQASGETVLIISLFEVEFASETLLITEEAVPFTDGNGRTWKPLTFLVEVEDIDVPGDLTASLRNYTLPAVDQRAAEIATGSESEYRNRRITQWGQIFAGGPDNRVPIDLPFVLDRRKMDRLSVAFSPDGRAAITLSCETVFAAKGLPSHGLLTEADQRSRYPDDAFLERVAELQQGRIVQWTNWN